jgi:uncharacterized protein
MDALSLIAKFYQPESLSYQILLSHSLVVAEKATHIAKRLNLSETEIQFIREASLLHDIGILYTNAPSIGCSGDLPYICHGFKGCDLLISEGLPKHALVCERHTGVGLTFSDIDQLDGLLPPRLMVPQTTSEKIIAYSDKFFSKDPDRISVEMTFESALEAVTRYGESKGIIFTEWHHQFNP